LLAARKPLRSKRCTHCLMTIRAGEARRNRWERVAALSSAARDGSGCC
jgi:hypothetical protein